MTYAAFFTTGYTDDVNGYSGAFSWFRSKLKPGFWIVAVYETSFSTGGYAVIDDFGNLVRVTQ